MPRLLSVSASHCGWLHLFPAGPASVRNRWRPLAPSYVFTVWRVSSAGWRWINPRGWGRGCSTDQCRRRKRQSQGGSRRRCPWWLKIIHENTLGSGLILFLSQLIMGHFNFGSNVLLNFIYVCRTWSPFACFLELLAMKYVDKNTCIYTKKNICLHTTKHMEKKNQINKCHATSNIANSIGNGDHEPKDAIPAGS